MSKNEGLDLLASHRKTEEASLPSMFVEKVFLTPRQASGRSYRSSPILENVSIRNYRGTKNANMNVRSSTTK